MDNESPEKTPEQLKLENIENMKKTLRYCDYVCSILSAQYLTLDNIEQTQESLNWLKAMAKAISKEIDA